MYTLRSADPCELLDKCKIHTPRSRSEREACNRVSTNRLSKPELEDLYYSLQESNAALKSKLYAQDDQIKNLNAKIQRLMSGRHSFNTTEKECCIRNNAILTEQRAVISELTLTNHKMTEKIKQLNRQICSTKQFLHGRSTTPRCHKCRPRIHSASYVNPYKSEVSVKHCMPVSTHHLEKSPIATRSVATYCYLKSKRSAEAAFSKPPCSKKCGLKDCQCELEELKQRNDELENELFLVQEKHINSEASMERDCNSIRAENLHLKQANADLEQNIKNLTTNIRNMECERCELTAQLTLERRKCAELEAKLRQSCTSSEITRLLERHLSQKLHEDSVENAPPAMPMPSIKDCNCLLCDPTDPCKVHNVVQVHNEPRVSLTTGGYTRDLESEIKALSTIASRNSTKHSEDSGYAESAKTEDERNGIMKRPYKEVSYTPLPAAPPCICPDKNKYANSTARFPQAVADQSKELMEKLSSLQEQVDSLKNINGPRNGQDVMENSKEVLEKMNSLQIQIDAIKNKAMADNSQRPFPSQPYADAKKMPPPGPCLCSNDSIYEVMEQSKELMNKMNSLQHQLDAMSENVEQTNVGGTDSEDEFTKSIYSRRSTDHRDSVNSDKRSVMLNDRRDAAGPSSQRHDSSSSNDKTDFYHPTNEKDMTYTNEKEEDDPTNDRDDYLYPQEPGEIRPELKKRQSVSPHKRKSLGINLKRESLAPPKRKSMAAGRKSVMMKRESVSPHAGRKSAVGKREDMPKAVDQADTTVADAKSETKRGSIFSRWRNSLSLGSESRRQSTAPKRESVERKQSVILDIELPYEEENRRASLHIPTKLPPLKDENYDKSNPTMMYQFNNAERDVCMTDESLSSKNEDGHRRCSSRRKPQRVASGDVKCSKSPARDSNYSKSCDRSNTRTNLDTKTFVRDKIITDLLKSADNLHVLQTQQAIYPTTRKPDSIALKTYSLKEGSKYKFYSCRTPSDTDSEISSMSDLPSEKEAPVRRSLGEDRAGIPSTSTELQTTDYASLSEGEVLTAGAGTDSNLSIGETRVFGASAEKNTTSQAISLPNEFLIKLPRNAHKPSKKASSAQMKAAITEVTKEMSRCNKLLQLGNNNNSSNNNNNNNNNDKGPNAN